MPIEIWLIYVATVLLFMSTPGPSHLLMLSVSASNGFRLSLATAAGDLSANIIQMILAGLGLAAIVASSRYGFALVKWAGVAYLIWMGVRKIIESFKHQVGSGLGPRASLGTLYLRGFITSAANPKAVVFFAALFPQFISPDRALAPQLLVLGATYVVIDGLFLCAYGKGASWIAEKIAGRYRVWIDRAAGTGLVAAAILLGLKTNARS